MFYELKANRSLGPQSDIFVDNTNIVVAMFPSRLAPIIHDMAFLCWSYFIILILSTMTSKQEWSLFIPLKEWLKWVLHFFAFDWTAWNYSNLVTCIVKCILSLNSNEMVKVPVNCKSPIQSISIIAWVWA